MKSTIFNVAIPLVIIAVISVGCSGQSETASGINYEFINHGTGEVPPEGGKWLLNMAYYDQDGKKIFSTLDQGGAMPMSYSAVNFTKNASFEECFSMIGKGDSAVFFVSADSLFKNTYGQPVPPEYAGTKIKVCIGVEGTYSNEEFIAYQRESAKERLEVEKTTIANYLGDKGINATTTEDGLYYEITQLGDGPKPVNGQMVKVNYTGSLLDGTVFDSSIEEVAKAAGLDQPGRTYEPISFELGSGRVIKGWDLGLALLPVGSKAIFVIPSPLGWGNRSAGELIKANSIVVFEVELLEIEN